MERIENIEGFPGYFVTSCGKVWSYKQNKFRKLEKTRNGYYRIALCNDNSRKDFFIHRLVAAAYLDNPNNLPQVDHIDRDKEHNYVNNLRWTSSEENLKNRKNPQREIVCVETGKIFKSQREAAKEMGLHYQNINHVLKGKYKTTGGYHFEYVGGESDG